MLKSSEIPAWQRWALIAAVVAIVAVGLAWWWQALVPNEATPMAPSARAAVASTEATHPAASSGLRNLPVAPIRASAASAGGTVEACGLGQIGESKDAYSAPDELLAAVDALRPRLIEHLRARGDDASAVLAQRLALSGATTWNLRQLHQAARRCEGADEPCDPHAGVRLRDVPSARTELIRIALGTSDPSAYAEATHACRGVGAADTSVAAGQSACRQLSARHWAALEPGNGDAWLHVAGEASAAGDQAGVAEAVYRLGQSTSFRARFGVSAAALLEESMPGAPAARLQIAVELIGEDAARPLPAHQALRSFCSLAAVSDANRRQLCDAAAQALVTHGDTEAALALGRSVGQRVGWPADRIARLRAEEQVLRNANIERATADDGPEVMSCAAIERMAQIMHAVAMRGEIGASRDWLQRSGKDLNRLVAKQIEAAAAATSARASAAGS